MLINYLIDSSKNRKIDPSIKMKIVNNVLNRKSHLKEMAF